VLSRDNASENEPLSPIRGNRYATLQSATACNNDIQFYDFGCIPSNLWVP